MRNLIENHLEELSLYLIISTSVSTIFDLRRGLATDRGLYMPERIKQLPKEFFDGIAEMSFQEIAYQVADAFFGEDIPAEDLKRIVYDTLEFDAPVVHVDVHNTASKIRDIRSYYRGFLLCLATKLSDFKVRSSFARMRFVL